MIFDEREKSIFGLLKEAIKEKLDFVVIGGYAINAYTLPRFSVDCDVVVRKKEEMEKFRKFLEKRGFSNRSKVVAVAYKGEFVSMASKEPLATFDILSGSVEDRLSGTVFPADFIFKYSSKRDIFGKGSPSKVEARVVDPEMLFIMKAVCGRSSDIRDVFMLASIKLDRKKLSDISSKFPLQYDCTKKILETAGSKSFRDSLQGVYGKLPEPQFEATLKKLRSLLSA